MLVRAHHRRAAESRGGRPVKASTEEWVAERELVERAEAASRRLVADWKASGEGRRCDKGARIFWAL